MKLISKIRSTLRAFRDEQSGVSTVEFALVTPVLLLIFIPAAWETTNAVLAKRKASQTANVLADLATQSSNINAGSWAQMSQIVERVLFPYDRFDTRLRLIGVRVDNQSRIRVEWQYGTARLDPNSLPDGLLIPNSFYVMSATEVDYEATIGKQVIGDMTFRDTAILTPRLTTDITPN